MQNRETGGMSPVAYDEPECGATDSNFICNLPPGHKGGHAAYGADDVTPVHTWPQS